MRGYRYLLGTSKREASRLQRQAELWDPVAHALFDRLKIRPGMRVLEIGPGMGSLHRELRRRVRGPCDAVERSESFAHRLVRLCRRDRYGEGHFWISDLIDAVLPENHYDFVFARWVFLFLPDPLAHLKRLVRTLRPGGVLALQDYHRKTLGMVPAAPHWGAFLRADEAFFASQGGNASIADQLPALFPAAGLKVVEVHPEIKVGHPGSATWKWLSDYFLGVMSRYGQSPPFSPKKARQLATHWRNAAREPTSLLIAPAVVSVVGRKRG